MSWSLLAAQRHLAAAGNPTRKAEWDGVVGFVALAILEPWQNGHNFPGDRELARDALVGTLTAVKADRSAEGLGDETGVRMNLTVILLLSTRKLPLETFTPLPEPALPASVKSPVPTNTVGLPVKRLQFPTQICSTPVFTWLDRLLPKQCSPRYP